MRKSCLEFSLLRKIFIQIIYCVFIGLKLSIKIETLHYSSQCCILFINFAALLELLTEHYIFIFHILI